MRSIQQLAPGAEGRLQALLGLYQFGCPADFTSPLISSLFRPDPDLGRSVVREEFERSCKLGGLPMWLRDREDNALRKIGTYSRTRPWDEGPDSLESSINKYFEARPWNELNQAAADFADRHMRDLLNTRRKLVPTTLEVAVNSFESRTGLGWPWVSSQPKFLPECTALSRRVLESHDCIMDFPAILGTRGQPRGPYQYAKTRAVFQCSRVVGNIEKMIFIPLFNHLRYLPCFAAWVGKSSVDWEITQLLSDTLCPVASVDFSGFDASVPHQIINRQFHFIRECFAPIAWPLINAIQTAFNGLSIVTPSGTLVGKARGIPSGSVLTNMIGSLVNIWVNQYAAFRCGVRIGRYVVQGDDGVYSYTTPPPLEALSDVMLDELGMTLSVDKSLEAYREVHFLQNIHRSSYRVKNICVGVRPLGRVLNGMLSYERLTQPWNGYLDTLRWLQQLDNASEHPSFEAACEWFVSQDRYADLPLDTILQKAGGPAIVNALLSGFNKTPILGLRASPTLKMIHKITS